MTIALTLKCSRQHLNTVGMSVPNVIILQNKKVPLILISKVITMAKPFQQKNHHKNVTYVITFPADLTQKHYRFTKR